MKRKLQILSLIGFTFFLGTQCSTPDKNADVKPIEEVPIIYSTDLWSPHGDPDDHFDLATLFSLKNSVVKAVIIDNTMEANVLRTGIEKEPNFEAVKKMAALFNRDEVPTAAGLIEPLKSTTDDGKDQPVEEQMAIDLILNQLQTVEDSSAVFITTGSLRDICAAYNREPDLFNLKVKRFYVSLGDSYGTTGIKDTNVKKDIEAWKCIMNSNMPIFWLPTNPSKSRGGISRYVSYWHFVQAEMMLAIPERVRQFFISEGIPVQIESWQPVRAMWSTPAIIEAASLNCFQVGDELVWMTVIEANDVPDAEAVEPYEFVPIKFEIDDVGEITWEEASPEEASSVHIFKIRDYFLYNESMFQFLLKQFNAS